MNSKRITARMVGNMPVIPWVRPWSAALIIVMAASISGSCSGTLGKAAAAGPKPEDPVAGRLTVPENQLPHLQIQPVKKKRWAVTLHATGTVDWDADHTTQAITQVSGPITRILVDVGSIVDAGAPLLTVSSPDITNAIASYRKARNRVEFEARTLERNKDLFAHRAIAQKDLESVQADYNDAATDLENALQTLRIFGISDKEIEAAEHQAVPINPELAVRAPIHGMIVQKLVLPGQLIQAGATTCFLISDPSTVWVLGHIYDRDLASVRPGNPVEVTSSSFARILHGTVTNIGAMIDPATRTTPVRITTSNPDLLLKKDLYVDLILHTRAEQDVLTVPTSAVLYDADNLPFVYVQMGSTEFAQRQVTLGSQRDSEFEVLGGLRENENVVSAGAVFLQFANTYQR